MEKSCRESHLIRRAELVHLCYNRRDRLSRETILNWMQLPTQTNNSRMATFPIETNLSQASIQKAARVNVTRLA
jgi:hypothetical protein